MRRQIVIAVSMVVCVLVGSACRSPYATPGGSTPTPLSSIFFQTFVPNGDPPQTPAPTGPASQMIDPIWGKLPEAGRYPTPIVNVIASDQQKFLMVEDYRGRNVVETETIPVNNCSGQEVVKVSVERSKTYSSSIEMGAEMTAGIDQIVKLAIATQYKINLGEARSYGVSVEFTASPGTNTVYTIEWVETWIVGRVFPVNDINNGRMNPRQYYAKSDLQVNIPDSVVQNCAP